ncbi:hypothetical protein V5799_011093 [Amblyomma americanum]|uniref:Uncharacterized protein n=1 Tax=Amblyomma americanum TaxID=6943 RepID=A0AAQ4EHV3_AMBAM
MPTLSRAVSLSLGHRGRPRASEAEVAHGSMRTVVTARGRVQAAITGPSLVPPRNVASCSASSGSCSNSEGVSRVRTSTAGSPNAVLRDATSKTGSSGSTMPVARATAMQRKTFASSTTTGRRPMHLSSSTARAALGFTRGSKKKRPSKLTCSSPQSSA